MSHTATPLPTPLISAADLAARMAAPRQETPLSVLDARFDLGRPDAGESAYAQGHLPGALYAHLERDLSAMPPAPALNGGRHPLPPRDVFARTVAALGITPATAVVVYDDAGGMYAARAWWMLRWLGHEAVAVLDGGLGAWTAAGGTLEAGVRTPQPAPAPYPMTAAPAMPSIDVHTLLESLEQRTVIDARGAPRYRGEVEPLDPVAGHIPGALNHPYTANLGADGRFLPPAQLREVWMQLLGATGTAQVVHQCGSGVTACHNLLAMAVAGWGDTCLYPGSWSEWCSDPRRPVARG